MSEKMIRFLDGGHTEIFRVPDGGKIRIVYPPGDGRETAVRACEYIDEHHFKLLHNGGGDVFHIDEFASRMAAMGARVEPELSLSAELAPGAPEDAKLFYRNREEGNACVGYLRGDFGRGHGFFHRWFDQDAGRKTPEFQTEFQAVMHGLRRGVLKDHASMAAYCRKHPEARLPDGDMNLNRFGFKLETESRQYFVRCTTLKQDYFYVFCYDKPGMALDKAAPERDGRGAKPSVLKQIRETQRAPKAPRKEKAPGKNKDKGDAER
jgi:hypothetical protein